MAELPPRRSQNAHLQHLSRHLAGPVRMERMSQAPEKQLSEAGTPAGSPGRPNGTTAARLPLGRVVAGHGDPAGAAAHRAGRPADRRAGHRASPSPATDRAGWPAISTAIRCPAPEPRGDATFNRANSGDCLTWPDVTPESASIVNCTDDHKFEVAESIDMRTFPGSEYGPNAAPPSPARIQQISQEQCEAAVRRYLGTQVRPQQQVHRQHAVGR